MYVKHYCDETIFRQKKKIGLYFSFSTLVMECILTKENPKTFYQKIFSQS